MRAIQRPRVRVKSSCGMRRSKMRMSRTSSKAVRATSPGWVRASVATRRGVGVEAQAGE